jgi:hypothetical protein
MKQYFLSGMALALLAVGMTASSPVQAARFCNSTNQGATYTTSYLNYGPNYIATYMCIGNSWNLIDVQVCSGSPKRCTSL